MATHDEELKKFFKHSSVNCVLAPRYGSSKLGFIKQQACSLQTYICCIVLHSSVYLVCFAQHFYLWTLITGFPFYCYTSRLLEASSRTTRSVWLLIPRHLVTTERLLLSLEGLIYVMVVMTLLNIACFRILTLYTRVIFIIPRMRWVVQPLLYVLSLLLYYVCCSLFTI